LISQSGWTLQFVDSQELSDQSQNGCCPPTPATNAFDGNPNTFWNTEWVAHQPAHPHEIQINLGADYSISGFRHLPRQDGFPNGGIGQYEFYVSTDGINWGSPVASGSFPDNTAESEVLFTPQTGHYVRLVALSTYSVDGFSTSLAELNVLTDKSPEGNIDAPSSDVTIMVGQGVNFAGSGTDADNDLPLTYHWNFGAGSGIPDSTAQNPGVVQFDVAGTFTVSFTVTNSRGLADPTPATRKVTVLAPYATLIPQQSWSVRFVDSESIPGQGDQPVFVENGIAERAFDGNPNTVWETQYLGTPQPSPPHELQIDLGNVYDVCGFSYLPRQQGTPHGRFAQYEFYVSLDGVNWGAPLATGSFPNTAEEERVLFAPKTGQFIRIRELTEVDGQIYGSIAELNVYQSGTASNQVPSGGITAPAQNTTIVAGSAISLAGNANDPGGNLPLTYRWSFQPGCGIDDIPLKDPGLIRFNAPGTFVVTFTVVNSLGVTAQDTRSIIVLGGNVLIPKTNWAIKSADSEALLHAAASVFDGDISTFWETDTLLAPPLPHEIQIDLGTTYDVGGFRYLPRQDSSEGRIGAYRFYVSMDGVNWGSAVASGTFTDTDQEQEVVFASTPGRYVRLQATTEVNGQPYTSVAELDVLEAPMLTPSVKLIQPRSDYLQNSTNLYVLAEASLNSGQGIRLSIDGGTDQGGAQVDIYNGPFETTFSNISVAPHTIDAYVIDSQGSVVTDLLTHDEAVGVGIGDEYVAIGDSITSGFRDDVHSDDTSQDGMTTGGGYEPILADLLAAATGYPIVIHDEGIGGDTSADGAGQIQRILQKHRDAIRFLILYGTNDAEPTGQGLHPGSSGYAGTFKDNMQRIINDIKSAGKIPVLAKVPPELESPQRNAQLQSYNTVIDELVSENNISVSPPDFYSYFSAHPEEFADSLHPNGVGYQSMARIWFQALTQ
jgi:lysophospholipase L1-like esterase